MKVIPVTTGALLENAYIAADEEAKEAIVIDPGDDAREIEEQLDRLGLGVAYILLTHGHADHIGAVEELKNRYHAKVAIHAGDAEMLVSARSNLSGLMGNPFSIGPADILLEDGDMVEAGNLALRVLHTPGHSPGSVCFLRDGVIFSGDTLFEGSIGRTDFPGSSMEAMRDSLKRLKELEGDYDVYPGHGAPTTLAQEKAMNPYMGW
ncbi:MBL fold metallo-hydrolase [Christensenella intestinihominis]|uniref:MBL fold metallo-hydrolase n=1 Tax=Christensenella intestinihominis TaxID=1851429 RepID=UPI0008352D9C|nr:MBL fold metallo-hydrolase [Christensenella intestinihominis]